MIKFGDEPGSNKVDIYAIGGVNCNSPIVEIVSLTLVQGKFYISDWKELDISSEHQSIGFRWGEGLIDLSW